MFFRKYLFLFAFVGTLHAQQLTQTIRGTVLDKISQSPLPGATIVLVKPDTLLGTSSDANGKFQLTNIPVGKQSLKITFLGYKELILQNLVLNTGKELVLTIQLEEDIHQMKEAVVTAEQERNKALNFMSTVSTRTFTVEETQKFAAALNDPAVMATSFAGVVQAGDGNNITIRGNSSNGLLWRMEGVEIPNPNHFSSAGSSGGGISILSAQLLSNSDFSTGAFAAEYGNALSGVFDLKLRKGNNLKREYTVQLSAYGADLALEGPFKKGYDGSYLINYRYSSLLLFKKLNLPIGDAITNFQDLSFNFAFPTKKIGNFTVFGLGGISYQITEAKKDSALWKEDEFNQLNTHFSANTGAVGLTNTKLFHNQSYLRTVFVFSGTLNGYKEAQLQNDYTTIMPLNYENHEQKKITLSMVYTQKLNAKSNIRLGYILNHLIFNLERKRVTDSSMVLRPNINKNGTTQTLQAFFQWNYQFSDQLSFNAGLHYLQLFLNNSHAIEPRIAFRYEPNAKHQFTLGYGLHSQIQPLGIYFSTNDSTPSLLQNKNLGLSKAHHVILGYDFSINEFSHIKTELYYQHLFNIPISADTADTYCVLNATDGYSSLALNNNGLGKNYGIELTYERYLHKNFYYLIALSLFDSKYKAANGNWYNTHFNSNYSSTITIGKEFVLSERYKERVIGINLKSSYIGGFRYTPIDLNASIAAGETRYLLAETNTKKIPDYFRADVRLSLKRNFKRLTVTTSIDIQNVSNQKNAGGQYFDFKTGEVKYYYLNGLIPILAYRLEF